MRLRDLRRALLIRRRREVDEARARVGGMGAGEDPHQGRLAGPVAAHEADDLAGVQVQGGVPHRVDTTERDIDPPHLDERRSLGNGHRSLLHAAHEPRRRFRVSKPTARISTMPAATFWPGELTPMKLRP